VRQITEAKADFQLNTLVAENQSGARSAHARRLRLFGVEWQQVELSSQKTTERNIF
jgi:hypothetical protein